MDNDLTLLFTPTAPTLPELASALAGFPLVQAGMSYLTVCALTDEEEDEAECNECLRIDPPRLIPPDDSAPWLPQETLAVAIEYRDEGLVKRVVATLAGRFTFLVDPGGDEVYTARAFANRVRRGSDWSLADLSWRQSKPPTIIDDPNPTAPAHTGSTPSPATTSQTESLSLPAWRPLGSWLLPASPHPNDVASFVVSSLTTGFAFELGGRLVPGLLGWFARHLRQWRDEIEQKDTTILNRPAAYLFLYARAHDHPTASPTNLIAWYRHLSADVRGYGDSRHTDHGTDVTLADLFTQSITFLADKERE